MSSDMGLHIGITADAVSATTELGDVEARLSALEQAFIRASSTATEHAAATEQVGLASTAAAEKVGVLKAEVNEFGLSAEAVSKHAATLAKGFQAAGLGAAGAASRVAGLTGALEELKGAAPQLLLLAGAFTAVAGSYGFIKDAITQASKWQQAMMLLGQTVKNQGGDWAILSGQVERWANLQEATTTFTRDQAVSAVKLLTATGMSLSDAMKSVRVAEDASAASGKSLSTVVRGLMEAEHGRTQVLAALGIGTREQIKVGMTYHAILQTIEKDMGGAAQAATQTLGGAWKQLGDAMDKLSADIGTQFLPQLTGIVQGIRGIVDEVDANLPTIIATIDAFGNALKTVWNVVMTLSPVIEGLFITMIGVRAVAAVQALSSLISTRLVTALLATSFNAEGATASLGFMETLMSGGLVAAISSVTASLGALITAENLATLGIPAAIAGAVLAFQHLGDIVRWVEAAIGRLLVASSNFDSHLLGWIPGVNAFASAIRAIGNSALFASSNLEKLAAAKRTAAQIAEDSSNSKAIAMDQLVIQNSGNQYTAAQVAAARADMQTRQQSASAFSFNNADTNTAFDAFVGGPVGPKKAKHGKSAAAQAQHELNAEIQNSLKYLSDLSAKNELTTAQYIAGLKRVESEYKLTQAQRASIDHQIASLEHKEQQQHSAEEMKAFNDERTHLSQMLTIAKDTFGQHSAAYIKEVQKEIGELSTWLKDHKDADQKMVDDIRVAMAQRQKIVTDENAYEEKQAEALQKKQHQELQREEDQLSRWSDRAISYLDRFFKHGKHGMNNMADLFQSMIKTMEQALEKSALMSLLGQLFNIPTAGFGSLLSSNLSSAFGLSSLFGGAGAAAAAGGVDTVASSLGNAALVQLTGSSNAALASALSGASGIGGSGGAGALGAFGGLGALLGVGAGAIGVGSLMGSVMHDSPGNNNAIYGSLAGVAGAGLLAAGGSLAGVGMSGAVGGLLASGPLGWGILAGGAILGGLFGGLFGPHGPRPDVTDTQNYGSIWANLVGAGHNGVAPIGANGSSFTEATNVSKALGGEGELQYISSWITANPAEAAKLLTPQELQDFTGATTITDNKGNNWTLNNGVIATYTDLGNAANAAITAIKGLGGAAAATATAVYNVSHSFPDWQNPQVALGGTYTPGGPTIGPGNGGGGGVGTGGGPVQSPPDGGGASGGNPGGGIGLPVGSGGTPGGSPPTIHVHLGTINVGGLVQSDGELASTISQLVAKELSANLAGTTMRTW